MHNEGPSPKEAIDILDRLVSKNLTDEQFRVMHHLGDSIAGFRKYCGTIKSFQRNGENRKLANKLERRLATDSLTQVP